MDFDALKSAINNRTRMMVDMHTAPSFSAEGQGNTNTIKHQQVLNTP